MTPRSLERPPVTESMLRRDLTRLGVEPGMTLTVHASLSAIGWVLGGAPTVVRALIAAIGEQGTLAMPAATPHCADPEQWTDLRIPECWRADIRAELPVFDPLTTPTTMGAIAETFRTWPGARRSVHPLESVCARGPQAARITRTHPLAFSEGPESPFGTLNDLGSHVLLLGVGFNRCTALHLAETLVERRRTQTLRFPVIEDGRRAWTEVTNVADDNDTHFPVIGERYLAAGHARRGTVGEAPCALFPMPDLVEFAVTHLQNVL